MNKLCSLLKPKSFNLFAQALDPILSQMNPVHTLIPYFLYHPVLHTNKAEGPVNARKTYGGGSWNTDPLILNLGNSRVVVSCECRPLHARIGALSTHWIEGWMGRKAYGHFGGDKETCLPLPGKRTTIPITFTL